MNVLISSLVRGMNKMEDVAEWVNDLGDSSVGVELIAFTHDDGYWKRLEGILENITCPVSFHGPYVKTEGTSPQGSAEYEFLIESYRRVFKLAAKHKALHVVYHMTQLGFPTAELEEKRKTAEDNASFLMALAREHGVELLIENLPWAPCEGKLPLYSNDGYSDYFDRFPNATSIVDIGHAHMNGLDLEGFLRKHGDRVSAYHFHNNDGVSDLHNDIFDGSFSYNNFADIYKRYTPTANIVLEYEPHAALPWDECLERISFLKLKYGK